MRRGSSDRSATASKRAITPRTRAILPTQLNGRTADMDALEAIATAPWLAIVEDAAQALGSRFKGTRGGNFRRGAAISFFPAKMLGCLGDGGAVIDERRRGLRARRASFAIMAAARTARS